MPGTVPGTVDPKMNEMKVRPLGADSLVGGDQEHLQGIWGGDIRKRDAQGK